jgi:prolipoprotein diacylglyceryltransferase
LTGTYLALVFSARFGLEFFKTPQAVYEAGNAISVGQYLSLPFVVVGIALLIRAHRNRPGVAKEIL